MNQESNFFCVIPANILYSTELSEFQKLLLVSISGLINREGYCWASNSYFAKNFNKTERWISSEINKLSTLKFIATDTDKEKGNKRVIRLLYLSNSTSTPIEEKFHPYRRKVPPEYNRSNNINNKGLDFSKIQEDLLGDIKAFVEHRKAIKKPLTQIALDRLLAQLSKHSLTVQKQMLDQSIVNGWTGIFEIKQDQRNNSQRVEEKPREVPTMTLKQLKEMGLA